MEFLLLAIVPALGNSASTYEPLSWLWTACYLLLLLSPLEKGLQTKEGKGEKTKKSMFCENPKRTSNTHLQANAEYLRFEEFELEQRKADPEDQSNRKVCIHMNSIRTLMDLMKSLTGR